MSIASPSVSIGTNHHPLKYVERTYFFRTSFCSSEHPRSQPPQADGLVDSNSSRFMITMYQNDYYHGHHVVFGTVVKGMRVLRDIAAMGTMSGRPMKAVRILGCGVYDQQASEAPLPTCYVRNQNKRLTEDEWLFERERRRIQPGVSGEAGEGE